MVLKAVHSAIAHRHRAEAVQFDRAVGCKLRRPGDEPVKQFS